MLLKDLSHRRIKTIVSNFILNHISSSLIMQKKKKEKKEILICDFVSS